MLSWRLIFAALILIPLLSLMVADFYWSGATPGIILLPLGLIAMLLAAHEAVGMLRNRYRLPVAWPVYLGVGMIFLSTAAPMAWTLLELEYPPNCPLGHLGWPLSATAAAIGIVFAVHVLKYRADSDAILSAALSVFVLGYVGLLGSFLALLRFFEDNAWGMSAMVSMVFVVKMSDTGAYTFGKLFGRTKLAPHLSPGKTVEGALGGIFVAVLASFAYFLLIQPMIVESPPPTGLWPALAYGLIVAIAGMIGDLSESMLKRDSQRKDSSGWLRGLGGVLDVLDSVMLAGPAAFACWVTGLVGPLGS